MLKIFFIVGLLLGWLVAAIYPPPPSMAKRITGIFTAGKERVEEKIEERQDEIKETSQKEIQKQFDQQTLILKKQKKDDDD